MTSPKAGQFVLHAKALHGNPFDGHTLGPVVADMEKLTGVEARRIHVDKGYRGHNHPHRLSVWISGQVRRVTASIRREMKRRAAVEPVIGHVKAEHRMDRNYLKGRDGGRINASSPQPAITSACSCGGSQKSCVPSSGTSQKLSGSKDRLNQRSSAFFMETRKVEPLPRLRCQAERQRGEVSLIGRRAVKARIRTAASSP